MKKADISKQPRNVLSPEKIAELHKKELRKQLEDTLKFHDPCANIKSVGNGL